MSKIKYLDKAIQWVKNRNVKVIKSKHEEYEDPKLFINRYTRESIQPDISFTTQNGAKHYTDIAIKTENKQGIVTRWKLLSTMASFARGRLYILAPRGHKSFAERLVKKYKINATILSL